MPPPIGGADQAAEQLRVMTENLMQVQEGLAHASRNLNLLIQNLRGMHAPVTQVNEALKVTSTAASRARQAISDLNDTFGGMQDQLPLAQASMTDFVKAVDEKTKVEAAAANVHGSALDNLIKIHGRAAMQVQKTAIPAMVGWIDRISALGGGTPVLGSLLTAVRGIVAVAKNFIPVATALAAAVGLPLAPFLAIVGVVTAVAVAVAQTVTRFKEAQGMLVAFGGTVAGNQVSIMRLTGLLLRNQSTMAMLGVQAEDLTKAYSELTSSYGISAGAARDFGQSMMAYSEQSAFAVTRTLGMAKVTGVSAEQVMKFTSAMGVLGEDVRKSDLVFGRVASAATRAGVNVADMTNAITTLGAANIYAQRPLDQMLDSLGGFAEGIMISNNALFTGANRAKLAAQAINAIADASARLDMPNILAFGGVMKGMTGTMDDIMVRASKLDRADIFQTALEAVESAAAPGSRAMAKTLMAMQMGISDTNVAMAIGTSTAVRGQTEMRRRDAQAADKTAELVSLARTSQLSLKNIEKATMGMYTGAFGRIFGARYEAPPPPPPTISQRQMLMQPPTGAAGAVR